MDAMNGDVIDPNGRGLVKYDPLCTHMEWKPIDIREVLLERDFIIAPKKKQDNPLEYPYAHVGSECLKGKVIAIYFATTWVRQHRYNGTFVLFMQCSAVLSEPGFDAWISILACEMACQRHIGNTAQAFPRVIVAMWPAMSCVKSLV